MRRTLPTLVFLACVTFLLGLGRQAISDSDEGFYAEASREMVESGDWLTPRFNYQDRWQKPVLYYWVTAATYLVTGPTEWAARLWSALSGLALVIVTWAAAKRLFGREDTAWLAGAIVATCYGYFAMARLALPDLPLACLITMAIWTALERRWLLAGLAAGLGFLMKGPVTLVVVGLVLMPIWWREGPQARPRVRDLAAASAVFAAVGLPWYAVMILEHGAAYVQSFFIGDNLERFATDRFNEPRGILFYIPIVFGGLFPWSAYLLLPWRTALDTLRRRRLLDVTEWRLLIWAAMPLLFFTISIGKQPRYILPVLPPIAIVVARAIIERLRSGRGEDAAGLRAATWATAILYLVLAVLLTRARALFLEAYPLATGLSILIVVLCGCVLAWVAVTRRWRLLPQVMTISAALLLVGVQFGALAGRRPEPVERLAALIQTHRRADTVIGTYQVFTRNLGFYTRSAQRDLFDESAALELLRSPGHALLVVRAEDLPRLEAVAQMTARRLGAVQYLNTANIRLRALLSPIPEDDIETVLLVSNR